MDYAIKLLSSNTMIYLVALLVGLYVHFRFALSNGRTATTNFWDYWLKETPGMSIATGVAVLVAADSAMRGPGFDALAGMDVAKQAFLTAVTFDALIQAPQPAFPGAVPATVAVPPAPKAAGFARVSALLLVLTLALAGCAWLAKMSGNEAPKDEREALAYAYSELGAARGGILKASVSNLLTLKAEKEAEAYADQVMTGLDAARVALRGCVDLSGRAVTEVAGLTKAGTAVVLVQQIRCNPNATAQDQLALANVILGQLNAYLLKVQAEAAAKK